MGLQEQFADMVSGRLQEVVQAALGEPGAALGEWEAVNLKGGFAAQGMARSLFMLRGLARTGETERPWSMVLKALVPAAGQDEPTDIAYWKREPLICASGLLDDLPVGLGTPRCYGCDERADGTVWLWLEHVREDGDRAWSSARWALAARHLGQFNGAYLVGRPLPDAPWLAGRRAEVRPFLLGCADEARRLLEVL